MKNIHVLPTDKPSRLMIDTIENKLYLQPILHEKTINVLTQNIYITSDKEIKDEILRWIIDNREGMNGFIHQVSVILDSKICPEIILTTDQDLILDGVQAIDDEFLEWFVKNPSCESVRVNNLCYGALGGFADAGYKIIIPKEIGFKVENGKRTETFTNDPLITTGTVYTGTSGTTAGFMWSEPTRLQVNERIDSIEMIYEETSLATLTIHPSQPPQKRYFKIVFSCVDGLWNKSERIYGEKIEREEYFEFKNK
jgi:hypothetical protein